MHVFDSRGWMVRLTVRSSSSPWIVPVTTKPVVPSTRRVAIRGIFAAVKTVKTPTFALSSQKKKCPNIPTPSEHMNASSEAAVNDELGGVPR